MHDHSAATEDQTRWYAQLVREHRELIGASVPIGVLANPDPVVTLTCLLYTSDAADERSSVDLGGRRIIKKTKHTHTHTKKKKQE